MAAENGKATTEKERDAAQEKVKKLSGRAKEVTGGLKSVTKDKKAAEERDAALKTVEKSTKAAEAAEARNDDSESKITYLQRQVQATISLSNGYGLRVVGSHVVTVNTVFLLSGAAPPSTRRMYPTTGACPPLRDGRLRTSRPREPGSRPSRSCAGRACRKTNGRNMKIKIIDPQQECGAGRETCLFDLKLPIGSRRAWDTENPGKT